MRPPGQGSSNRTPRGERRGALDRSPLFAGSAAVQGSRPVSRNLEHHLELLDCSELDAEVAEWRRQAYDSAA